ncbi:MAG: hypothetical protein FWC92_10025 [Defluviitaleaceae bacterium]|nr:hypothetical protein [Defluviitaleaceae bacterium]
MAVPIVLYDENHERVGETYHRRAKQLVRSGRAVWLEDGHSLLMAPQQAQTQDVSASPPTQEDLIMTESIYTNNGPPPSHEPPEATHTTGINELRMYLARQNVARKRSLVKNLVAYALVWLALISIAWVTPATHVNVATAMSLGESDVIRVTQPFTSGSHRVRGHNEFQAYRFDDALGAYIIEIINNNVANALEGIPTWLHPVNTVQFEFSPYFTSANASFSRASSAHNSNSSSSFWFFIVGIMFAWGVWILARGINVARQSVQNRPKRPLRPDPVAMEYQRLSTMADYE